MAKLKLGDLFTINTSKGNAYIQFVHSNKNIGEMIRVLPGLYFDPLDEIEKLIQKNELFLVHFPLKAAVKQKIVSYVGNFNIPNHFKIPQFMRSIRKDKDGNFVSWYIVNCNTWKREAASELSEEQKKLSPWGIWNDTLLIEKLCEGWTLENWG